MNIINAARFFSIWFVMDKSASLIKITHCVDPDQTFRIGSAFLLQESKEWSLDEPKFHITKL